MSNFSDTSKEQPGGHNFQPQSVVFNTVKSTSGHFLLGTAFGYVGLKIINAITADRLSAHYDLPLAALLGSYLGMRHGNDALKHTQIYNDKTAILNKYQSLPDIQSDVYAQMGGLNYAYHATKPEQYLGLANQVGLSAFLGSMVLDKFSRHNSHGNSRWATISNAIGATTVLTMFGADLARVFGLGQAREHEQERVSFAEKIALQRAAGRAGLQTQAV